MYRAAARRLLKLLGGLVLATAVVSLLAGLVLGSPLTRALSLGYYCVGSFLLIAGFFLGNRGPARQRDDRPSLLFGSRFVRWATPEERDDAINSSAVFVTLGLALIIVGVLADTRYSLF